MAPETVHRIAQEIRHRRAELTTEYGWHQSQTRGAVTDHQREAFRRIEFWRGVLALAEQRLSET